MSLRIVVMPGDDIGPEITAASLVALNAANRKFAIGLELQTVEVGMASYRRHGNTLTEAALEAAISADGVILGPCGMSDYPAREEGGTNVPGTVRKRLDLFANLRPARSRPGVPRAREGLDILIVRENTEGFYSDRNMHFGIAEFMPTPDVALSMRKITREGSRRIAQVAFEYAARRRRRVAVVGKRHVLQLGDGLFVGEAEKIAAAHRDVELREVDVDAMAADLVMRPERYDVILTSNMFGDILSNEAVALSGGLGLAAALNVGDAPRRGERRARLRARHRRQEHRQPGRPHAFVRHAARVAGGAKEFAAMPDAARALTAAIDQALQDAAARTGDLGGRGTTSGFGEAVARGLLP